MPTPSRTYQALLTDIAQLYAETRASVVRDMLSNRITYLI